MKAIPHFTFEGQAETALRFYASVFNGQAEHVMRYKDAAGAPGMDALADADKERILYSELAFGQTRIALCDQCPGKKVTPGDQIMMDVETETGEQALWIYDALAEGGERIMPMAPTFWTANFGMVRDRFGILWSIMEAEK